VDAYRGWDCGAVRTVNGPEDPAGSGVPFEPGDVFGFDRLSALEPYLPPEVWQRRDHFFFEGMRLEISPCFRSDAPPGFFPQATQTFAGRARALESGGLEGVPAGLPFEPDSIDASDPRAGQKWAWNVARRYRGAGSFGDLRLTYAQKGDRSAAWSRSPRSHDDASGCDDQTEMAHTRREGPWQ
jgi:hypothetical protein